MKQLPDQACNRKEIYGLLNHPHGLYPTGGYDRKLECHTLYYYYHYAPSFRSSELMAAF